MSIWQGYAFSIGYIACVLAATGAARKYFTMSEELSRKIVHILIGFTWPILYFTVVGTIHFVIVPVIFVAVNAVAYRFGLLSLMEREADSSPGTVYYPSALRGCPPFLWLYPRC